MKRIALIFGCQRSGTTAFLDFLMDAGPRLKVFPECDSKLTDRTTPEGGLTVRMNPLPDVDAVLAGVDEEFAIAKPLVESQRAKALLDHFPDAVGFWLYRDYRDVAASMVAKWGPPVGAPHLHQVLDTSDVGNWRHEGVPETLRAQVAELYSPDMGHEDAAALFWYVRNALFFEQGLERDPRVLLLDYQHMTGDPTYVDRALDHFGIPHPPAGPFFSTKFAGKGRGAELDPRVVALCDAMQARLDAHRFTPTATGAR